MSPTSFPPRELISSNKWTAALFTTFSLSLSFVEAVVYPEIRRTVSHCTILSALSGYAASLSEPGAPGAGREYEVVPVQLRDNKGIFHPKIALLSDGENVRATVGSGNLTLAGWGHSNAEVVDLLLPGRDSACYADLDGFLGDLSVANGRFDCDFPNLDEYRAICRKASTQRGDGRSRLLHTVREPLASQLSVLAQDFGGAESLAIVSPFFSGFAGVVLLAEKLACADVSVAIVPNPPARFDFAACKAAGLDVRPVRSDAWNDERRLHAKVFDIKCRNGRLIVTGSPNATYPALAGINVEAAVVRMRSDTDVYGWTPSGIHEGSPRNGIEPGPTSDVCAVASYDGARKITGRVLGSPGATGEWKGSLSWGASRSSVGVATVDNAGQFTVAVDEDLFVKGTSVQIVLERDEREIRGWVTMPGLDAKGPRARVARAIGRMHAGSDAADIQAILEYLLAFPDEFLEAAWARRGGMSMRDAAPPLDIVVPVSALSPVSAFAGRPPDGAMRSRDNFDRLMDALDRYLASTLGQMPEDTADDENEGDPLSPAPVTPEHGKPPERNGDPAPAKRRDRQERSAAVRADLFDAAFNAMLEKVVAWPLSFPKGPGFHALFDMALKIAPRCEKGEELEARLLDKWLQEARRHRDGRAGYDDLDRCVAALCTRKVMDDPAKARAAHDTLQRWLHGELDGHAINELEPRAENPEVAALRPSASQSEWTGAWLRIIETETSYSAVSRMMADFDAGRAFEPPSGVSPGVIDALRRLAGSPRSRDRVALISKEQSGQSACPRCYIVLPREAANELRTRRITMCRSCGRVVVDTSL